MVYENKQKLNLDFSIVQIQIQTHIVMNIIYTVRRAIQNYPIKKSAINLIDSIRITITRY